jgi:hypothetical protein
MVACEEERMTAATIPFALATASVSGSPAFALIVLDDEAAISVEAVAPLAARLGHGLTGTDSLHGLLQDWTRNFVALQAVVAALDDAELGKYVRSDVTALEFFDLHAPLPAQRQVFVSNTMQPATTIAGPRAKIPIPQGVSNLQAGLALAVIVGAPMYQATREEAQNAIAGYCVATRYTTPDGDTWAPAFLPTGPFLLPAPFADQELDGRISFNGETGQNGSLSQSAAIDAIRNVSKRAQLFPGDLIICPMGDICPTRLGDGDIIEAGIAGLGRQTTNIMVESKHANSGH